jgi:peptidoglycan/LPS O-acetylase OafA/YrhL
MTVQSINPMAVKDSSYYRPDIDGLRAVAVLAGLLFQARVPGFASGYVSVDIFFVISGFLITSIILRQIKEDKFSFRTFYLRRFRRILPALAVMLIGTLILSSFILLPEDFKLLGRHVAATILAIPNLSIWEASRDYFAAAVDANPLLDLWSLGVEEQFYLFTPGLLFLLIRYTSLIWLGRVLTGLFAGSFVLSLWLATHHPTVGYYSSPARAWEILCGVGLAYYHFIRPTNNQKQSNKQEWFAFAGLAAILASIVIPSGGLGVITFIHQSIAVLATTLLIHLHRFQPTRVSLLLAWKSLTGIGLISYPLYLWRWPLFSLYSYGHYSGVMSWYETFFLLLLCFILSYLTWRWVEQPARLIPINPSKSLIKWVVSTQLVLLLIGVGLWQSNGLLWRFSPTAIAYADGVKDLNPLSEKCNNRLTLDLCFFGGTMEEVPQFIIRGGSYADAMIPVFHTLGDKYALKGIQASLDSSPFLVGAHFLNQPVLNEITEKFNLSALKAIDEHAIKDIFLPGAWSHYIKLGLTSSNSVDSMTAFQEGMEKAVSMLVSKGKRVWIVLQVPSMDRPVPRWLALHAANQSEVWMDNPHPEFATNLRPFFDRLSKQYGVTLLDPLPYLCRADGKCLIAHKGKAVYRDEQGHLSASGSLLLEEMLQPAFEVMKQSK